MYEKGTKVYGFKYENNVPRSYAYMSYMDDFIGKVLTVADSTPSITSLTPNGKNRYSYPTEMIKDHLVDTEPEIDLKELLAQIKSL